MSLDLYIAYVVIAFFTIVSPGAAILLAIHNGLSLDLRAVAISTLGNILGLFILSTVAMFGVGVLLQTSALFFLILKIVGALYLIYLGAKQIFGDHARLITEDGIEKRKVYDTWKVFKKGFLLAVTNPKPILFFTAIFPLFMDSTHAVLPQFFLMTGTFMLISFCSLLFYGYMSGVAKSWFFDEKRLGVFYKVSGSLFVLMGIGMLFLDQKVQKAEMHP
jgi:threonine/homoserine/homoserine lactone efflux protein